MALIVRTPTQRIPDVEVRFCPFWKVSDLKQHLSIAYPSKPKIQNQKLIFGGKILPDELSLNDIFNSANLTYPVVHLVYDRRETTNFQDIERNISSANRSGELVLTKATAGKHGEQPMIHTSSLPSPPFQYTAQNCSNHVTSSTNTALLPVASAHTGSGAWQQYQQQLIVMHHHLTLYYLTCLRMANNNIFANYSEPVAEQLLPANGLASVEQLNNDQPRTLAADADQPGLAVNNEDEIDDNQIVQEGWLDWLNNVCCILLVLSVIFLYSSVERFCIVASFSLLIYMLNADWFHIIDAAEGDDENELEEQDQDQDLSNGSLAESSFVGCWYQRLLNCFSTFVLFFTTLIPNIPPPINVN